MNATQSLRPATGRRGAWRLAVGVAALLLFLLEIARFSPLNQLQTLQATSASPPFTAGIQLREMLERMSGAILQFQLSDDPDFAREFTRAAKQFGERIEQSRIDSSAADWPPILLKVHQEFQRYEVAVQDLLQRGVRGVRRETPALTSGIVRERTRPLQTAVEELAVVEARTWTQFAEKHQRSIRSLRHSNWISTACAAIVVVGAMAFCTGRESRWDDSEPQTEAGLLRQERLASLGALAAGVAHEIRNPLTALKFRIFSLRKALPTDFHDHEDLDIVSKEINRLERIVKDFLEFARPSEPRRGEVVAGQLMEEVHELLRSELERRGLHVRLEADPATRVWADRQQLQQILINLVQNAAESTPQGGTITLRARRGSARLFRRAQPLVLFEVADTGKGIPPEVETRVFDPFVSTKEGGTGLGLSIAARIAEMHDGHIQFVSQVGRGTTFTVLLPQTKTRSHESTDTSDRR